MDRYEFLKTLEEGEVKQAPWGEWYCRPPGSKFGASLANHTVVRNSDETVTVSPSILFSYGNIFTYHGFYENGQWREV